MYRNVFEFYRSKEWANLLAVLKQERVDADGQIICERCGKPIVKAYDIIGHHIEELTEENVHDANIALNPKNIQFLHHACHNREHHKHGFMHYKPKEVYLVYGAPLSGKTTWVRESMCEGDLVVDMDSIWQCISGQPRYVKPNRLTTVAFKMRDALIDIIKYRTGKWQTAYLIGGYPLQSERDLLCKQLGAREVYIDTSKAECLARLADETERDVDEWSRYIEAWFDKYNRAFA